MESLLVDPETGKMLGELIPAVRETLGTVPSDVVGIVGGDWLRHFRIRNWARLSVRTEELLRNRGKSQTIKDVSPSFLLPLATEAADEDRDELLELWARLIAAAADPTRRSATRKSFIRAIKEFDPMDALVFQELWKLKNCSQNYRDHIASVLKVGLDSVIVSFENLMRQGCVVNPSRAHVDWQNHPGESPSITGFGRELGRVLFD